MNPPLISIISPCFNGVSFIDRCVTSVLAQTETDWELLIINDGSTDCSDSVIKNWTKKDQRIKNISKNNGGVSSARNVGLDYARGKWITFLDIDDTLEPNALKLLINLAEHNKSDIVYAGYNIIKNDIVTGETPALREVTMTANELCLELFRPSDYPYQGYNWNKLYKKSIIDNHNIRFAESIKYNEDRLFVFQYLQYVKKGIYTSQPILNYYQTENGAMASINGPDYWKFETDLDAFTAMCRLADRFNSPKLTQALHYETFISYKRNRDLNKRIGNNDRKVNVRLKNKLLSVVPKKSIIRYRINDIIAIVKAKAFYITVKSGLRRPI